MLGVTAVEAVGLLEELCVAAVLDDATVVEDDDDIGVLNRREPMRDDERATSFEQPVQCLLHEFL